MTTGGHVVRLAHLSDLHVTLRAEADPLSILHPKRAMSAVNYYLFGRAQHFHGVEERIELLLADADATGADHVLCTGDVTSTSHEREFADAAALFGDRLAAPARYTVLPGNHDRYTTQAHEERRFERWFGAVSSPAGDYPLVKRVAPGVTVVALDVSRPTLLSSSGLCGDTQRERLLAVLTDRSLERELVVLALHYGLLRRTGRPDHLSHRLTDYRELIALIDREDVHVDLVVHGHIHRGYRVKTERRTVVCAGSATDLAYRCGYNVYALDLEQRTFTTERRVWNGSARAYEAENPREDRT